MSTSPNAAEAAEAAAIYLTECTLTTIATMAGKKSRPKTEYARQKAIAQQGIDYCQNFTLKPSPGTRAAAIISTSRTVEDWVAGHEVK